MDESPVVQNAEERTLQQMKDEAQELYQLMDKIVPGVIKLFGQASFGNVAYNRSLAIQKFEEAMHRVNDGLHFLFQTAADVREKTAEAALKQGQLTVVPGGK